MIDLTSKTILVTGGSRGIGAATVRQLVAHGGSVVVHFGSNLTAAQALADEFGGSSIHLCQADLTSESETEHLWDNALAWRGHIDILINNAGIYEKSPLNLDLGQWLDDWQRTLRINLLAAAQEAEVDFDLRDIDRLFWVVRGLAPDSPLGGSGRVTKLPGPESSSSTIGLQNLSSSDLDAQTRLRPPRLAT